MKDVSVNAYLQDCSLNYLKDIGTRVPGLPVPLLYPSGCPAGTVVPLHTGCSKIMVAGESPPPRMKIMESGGIPLPWTDPLSPLGLEPYFDGMKTIYPFGGDPSADYFALLGVNPSESWITTVIKVPLFGDSRKLLTPIALAGITWIRREIRLCRPSLIITLGENTGKIISDLYNGPLIRLPEPRWEGGGWNKETRDALQSI